ncbi:hypothetical protein [Candidatus Ichthyocystis hellenicum]|uniref:hypothetical protein n=1 Tax=Candidatus Ichthyocystis hellenicum TaxID=1561003 RepID=UPI000B80E48E|nr:hypothetical protein [Candidatus Ichthyocystis hellenicum]
MISGSSCISFDSDILDNVGGEEEEIVPENEMSSTQEIAEIDCNNGGNEPVVCNKERLTRAINHRYVKYRGCSNAFGMVSVLSIMIISYPMCKREDLMEYQKCGIVPLALISLLGLAFFILHLCLYGLERGEIDEIEE